MVILTFFVLCVSNFYFIDEKLEEDDPASYYFIYICKKVMHCYFLYIVYAISLSTHHFITLNTIGPSSSLKT